MFIRKVPISPPGNRVVHHEQEAHHCHNLITDGHFNASGMKYTADKS